MDKKLIHFILGGDVMLGRTVKEYILEHGADYPLRGIAKILRSADIRLVNLECAITASETEWSGKPKAFYFGAPPEAIESLKQVQIDVVSLANNHALDYDYQGLQDTVRALREYKINFAGAGKNLDEARKPTFFSCKGTTFGVVAYCDHQADFAAESAKPGIAYIDILDEEGSMKYFQEDLERMKTAKVDWPILSLHWGPNMVNRPSEYFVKLAHNVIDAGYKILFGHSAHVFHGVEIYKGCPILYAAGDLVDDYYVGSEFKNDHQLLFELVLDRHILKEIHLHPVFIRECQVVSAEGEQFEYIANRAVELCKEMETKVERTNQNELIIRSWH